MSFIPPVVIPTPNAVTNPLRANLDAGNFAITTASRVTGTTTETNTITTVPGSSALAVEFQDNIRMAGAKAVEFLGAGVPNRGNIVADPAVGLYMSGLRAGSQPQVLGYNASTREVVRVAGPVVSLPSSPGLTSPLMQRTLLPLSSRLQLMGRWT